MSQFPNIFLSFYLLFLACQPCHDIVLNVDCNPQTIVRSNSDSPANHGEDTDLCSPLCSCACCGNLMISPYTAQPEARVELVIHSVLHAGTKDTSGYISLLWQPPQLV